ncbi:hypothetical protein Tco_0572140, partial [Tanacetum coccineum]
KSDQAKEIAALKKKVQKLEKRKKSRTTGLKRLRKVDAARIIESFEDKDSLGTKEDVSKHGRSIEDLDADTEVTLVTENHERNDEEMFINVHDDLQG